MGTVKMKLPNYLLPSSVTFDPGSGEMYLKQNIYKSNDDITERLSRNTESSSSKLYKWQRKKSPSWRKAILVNKNPNFETVSQERAKSIADRLSRPTKSTRFRSAWDTESETDSNAPSRMRSLSAASRSSAASRVSSLRLPRPSARPDKPILVHPSARVKQRETNETPVRNVRFQSPLPQMEAAPTRQSRHSAASMRSDIIPPIAKKHHSPTREKRENSSERERSQSPGNRNNTILTSDSKSESSERKSSAGSVRSSSSVDSSSKDITKGHSKNEPTKASISADEKPKQPSVSETKQRSTPPSRKAESSSTEEDDSQSDDIPTTTQIKSPENKNMKLVLDYFSEEM